MPNQRRLADPRLAGDDHEQAAGTPSDMIERIVERGQLAVTLDQTISSCRDLGADRVSGVLGTHRIRLHRAPAEADRQACGAAQPAGRTHA